MEILLTPEQWVLDLYPEGNPNINLKLSNYIVKSEYEDKILLFHTITWSIYSLTKEEFDNITNNEILIKNKVIIPDYFNENEIANKVYVYRMTPPEIPNYENGISDFTVLTTTSCNARCFYCYEKGVNKNISMTTETAEDIVQFIARKNIGGESPLKIQWIGGEPLVNKRVINYITSRLKEIDVAFYSTLITNGFLLNEETINDIKTWNLRSIQITLDGTGDEYNKTKNYIYTDIDAYLTIIDNIHNVLNNLPNVNVSLRFNASNSNIFKLYDDIKMLKEEFKYHTDRKPGFFISVLYEYIHNPDLAVEGYWDELERLGEVAHVKEPNIRIHPFKNLTFQRRLINKHCKAYSGKNITILPDGKLSVCSLIRPEDYYGDIYNGITNVEAIARWQNYDSSEIDFCKEIKCPLHPICAKFFKCGSCGVCMTPEHAEKAMKISEETLIKTYLQYIDKLKNIKN